MMLFTFSVRIHNQLITDLTVFIMTCGLIKGLGLVYHAYNINIHREIYSQPHLTSSVYTHSEPIAYCNDVIMMSL